MKAIYITFTRYGCKFAIPCENKEEAYKIGYDLNSLCGVKYLRVSANIGKEREVISDYKQRLGIKSK